MTAPLDAPATADTTTTTDACFKPKAAPGFYQRLPKVELHAHLNGSISAHEISILLRRRPPPDADRLQLLAKLGITPGAGAEGASDEETAEARLWGPAGALERGLSRYLSLGGLSLEAFFPIFGSVVYSATSTLAGVFDATALVIEAFYEDGVRYLELRTTPRVLSTSQLNVHAQGRDLADAQRIAGRTLYLNTVIEAMEATCASLAATHGPNHDDGLPPITVRLIVCLDRRHSPEEGLEIVDIAAGLARAHPGAVVGVDLCGPPTVSQYDQFRPAFRRAKHLGLAVTLHAAEIPERADVETNIMLDDGVDRLGHGTYMGPATCERALRERVPLELCVSSNCLCGTIPSEAEHHFGYWHFHVSERRRHPHHTDLPGPAAAALRGEDGHHPVALCTDDRGVFGAELSYEYRLVGQAFDLSEEQLTELSRRAAWACFIGGRCAGAWAEGVADRTPALHADDPALPEHLKADCPGSDDSDSAAEANRRRATEWLAQWDHAINCFINREKALK
ncbi:hypothetical protein H696_03907 [Fonticula alba]|uniref:Adenosine deaminase domain-containing protein n=1 Tax=Fonticula alba TaxID=691883 RepID=A0A058Z5G9_FONAL|nr:hypothetical protein H696_03907 [Fonticula alba]KCV69480.1 hypothetical protein H696_03907 [Fonticula alba]|eukprot:XP_009496045.1 hypothetical protein H696_03907 [Fonticula alba]